MNLIILYPYLYVFPHRDNISLFTEFLFSDNSLPQLLKCIFGTGLSKKYDIESYLPEYTKECLEDIENSFISTSTGINFSLDYSFLRLLSSLIFDGKIQLITKLYTPVQ